MTADPFRQGGPLPPRSDLLVHLLDRLEQKRQISHDQREEIEHRMKWTEAPPEQMILEQTRIAENDLLTAMSEVAGLPVLRIVMTEIDPESVNMVPAQTVLGFRIMPVRRDGDALVLAVDRFVDVTDEDRLRLLLGVPIHWVLASRRDIQESIKFFYGVGLNSFLGLSSPDASRKSGDSRNGLNTESSIPNFVSEVLHDAVRSEATDIHVEPFERSLRIRYRIDGVLHTVPLPRGIERYQRAVISSLKIMAQLNIAEHRLPQDGRFSVEVDGQSYDLRMSVLPSQYGETVNLRILDRRTSLIDLGELGLPDASFDILKRLIVQPYGMILFSGPTGSGKTTSLYATLSKLNQEERKIITIEDPIEYRIHGITQMQVNAQIGFTFASGLRSVLRHDPNVVLIGEIRDLETAAIAISASMTGHLVLSTLHTNDSSGAISRLIDMGSEPYLVASSLQGVVAQRLVRRLCPACRIQDRVVDSEILNDIARSVPEAPSEPVLWRGQGCPECRFTGYQGRQAIFEILEVSDDLRAMAARRTPAAEIQNRAVQQGLITLRQHGWQCALAGITSAEEVLRVTPRAGS